MIGLDTSHDGWIGSWPGLGEVWVGPDAHVHATAGDPQADDADARRREDAVRFGWGEPLAFARRGFDLLSGTVVCDAHDRGLLLCGRSAGVERVMLELVRAGWAVVADGLTPARWRGGHLWAHPREAPVLVAGSRAEQAGVVGTPVRQAGDAVAVPVARASREVPVAAVVVMERRRGTDTESFSVTTGVERFRLASRLVVGGALRRRDLDADPDETGAAASVGSASNANRPTSVPAFGATEPAAPATAAPATAAPARSIPAGAAIAPGAADHLMAEHLRLAQLPIARLRQTRAGLQGDVAAVLAWWQEPAPSGTPT